MCSGANADLVTSLGADQVVDYTADDFTHNGQRYDVIMDNQGNATYPRVKGSLEPGGRVLMVYGELWPMIAASWQKAVVSGTATVSAEPPPNPRRPDRAGSTAAGDRFRVAVRPDRRRTPPSRQRPQGRQPRADIRSRRLNFLACEMGER